MNERKEGLPSSGQEALDYIYGVLAAPITYARELKEAVSGRIGGKTGKVVGWIAAAAPIILPIALPLAGTLREGNIPAGILSAIVMWTITGSLMKAAHIAGAIGPET